MNRLRLNLLICCYEDSVDGVPGILLERRDDVRYFVSHQHSSSWKGGIPDILSSRSDVRVDSFTGRGISQNRNHCLDMLRSADSGSRDAAEFEDICVVADDDVRYSAANFRTIVEAFGSHPESDIILFKIATPEGFPEFKKYSSEPSRILRPVLSGDGYASSIEMTFRYEPVRSAGVRFDESFGIGSRANPSGGEETVFLSDCLKAGLKVLYMPEYIVTHPYESTGKSRKTAAKADTMLNVCRRTVGWRSFETWKALARCLYRRIGGMFN